MKNPQVLIVGMVVFGAIAGSTLATVAYFSNRQSTPVVQTSPSPTPEQVTPSESPTTSLEPEASPPVKPTNDDLSSRPSFASQQPIRSTRPAQKPPQKSQPKASDFSQFKLRLLDATQRADANFIRTITTPQTQWNYGGTINLDSYNIDNNQSAFWTYMNKAISTGCDIDSQAQVANKEPGSSVWICPSLTKVKRSIRPDRPNFGHLAILGQNVNVRDEPGVRGRVVGSISYDYVVFNSNAYKRLPAGTQEQLQADVLNGWTPVGLRTGQQGWIQNRYVYDEENDYRVSFVRINEQWRLRYFLRGNGN